MQRAAEQDDLEAVPGMPKRWNKTIPIADGCEILCQLKHPINYKVSTTLLVGISQPSAVGMKRVEPVFDDHWSRGEFTSCIPSTNGIFH